MKKTTTTQRTFVKARTDIHFGNYWEISGKVGSRVRSMGIVWQTKDGDWAAEAQNTGNSWDGLDSMQDAIDIICEEYL